MRDRRKIGRAKVRREREQPLVRIDHLRDGAARVRVHQSLVDWGSRIPIGFSAGALAQADSSPRLLRFFGILYATRLSCLSLVSRAHSWDPEWVNSLQEFGEKAAVKNVASPLVLPHGWPTIVDESRNFMLLFMKVPQKDAAFVW